ncbi:hypothetical protein V8G54_011123 [Vigna mungo]|uniref:Uncharacterized protein n=1 Tax=Vigna mungo TaxID=3915 RepID=A0AAQ3NQZ5_VIGMU
MHPSKSIFLFSNPNTSLGPLYIFPVQAFLEHLHMFKRQRDTNQPHHFLGQRILTSRPSKHINHDMIRISFVTICWMVMVILRLLCIWVMHLSCWYSFHHLFSNKTELVSAGVCFQIQNFSLL